MNLVMWQHVILCKSYAGENKPVRGILTMSLLPAGDLVTSRQHRPCIIPQTVNTV